MVLIHMLRRFSGSVPSAWAMFPSLVSLNLGDNLLTGMFPASWAALQGKLLYLYLEQNTELKVGTCVGEAAVLHSAVSCCR